MILQHSPRIVLHALYSCIFYKPEIIEMGLYCQLLVGSVHLRSYCSWH